LVQGLFLSSAVFRDAEYSTQQIIETAKIVRKKFNFKGYIHLKVLPETSKEKIFEMAEYADRLSLNLEVPRENFLSEISSTKNFEHDLQKRLFWINEAKEKGILGSFTTRFILGASQETDFDIIKKMGFLYSETKLHRSYFSAFSPVEGTKLESEKAEFPQREHTLYQTDWLMRVYGFELKEIEMGLKDNGNFSLSIDPKIAIALNNPNQFPIDLNTAGENELLKVPGIGPKTAKNILVEREKKEFDELNQLKKLGVITKRAEPFIQINGSIQRRLSEWH